MNITEEEKDRVLITDGAGFVGSNFANYLIQHTVNKVVTVDDLSKNNLHNLGPAQAAKNRHSFYLAKKEDPDILKKILELEEINSVVYCYDGNEEVFTAFIAELPSSTKMFVSVESHIAVEDAIFEKRLERFATWNVVRPCCVFGPRQRQGFVEDVIKSSLAGETLDGVNLERVELLYIKDYFGFCLKVTRMGINGVYNLHSGEWGSSQEIQEFAKSLLSAPSESIKVWDTSNPSVAIESEFKKSFELCSAVEHTLVWYNKNRWLG